VITGPLRSPKVRDPLIGVGVGAFSGLMGVGGGIILMPYLLLVRKIPQKVASATSLVLVGMGAATGAVTYALDGHVAWIPGLCILIGGLIGAWLGAHLVQRLHDHRLQVAFGVLMVLVSIRMFIPIGGGVIAENSDLPTITALTAVIYAICGIAMGMISALFGIGGGVIMVPILVLGFGYGQQLANGTSLTVMFPIAMLGAIRLTKPGLTNWPVGLRLGVGAAIGAIGGAAFALAVPSELLRFAWAILLFILGVRMIRHGWKKPEPQEPESLSR